MPSINGTCTYCRPRALKACERRIHGLVESPLKELKSETRVVLVCLVFLTELEKGKGAWGLPSIMVRQNRPQHVMIHMFGAS